MLSSSANIMAKSNKLNFEYCECGCKSYTATLKGLSYTIYWDLKDSFYLYSGHGFLGTKLGTFYTYEKTIKAAQEHWDKS